MPPFLSAFRSRTNSLLDTITGVIPDAPPNGTFKDRSLTCRRCGNRFRDTLELGSHFNLFPHHSDYKDSHDFGSFVRPKVRCEKAPVQSSEAAASSSQTPHSFVPVISGFSQTQAHYAEPDKRKDKKNHPAILRKLSTLSNLTIQATGEQPKSPSATHYAETDVPKSLNATKDKGKQRVTPRPGRDDPFHYGQILASSDEEADTLTSGPSCKGRIRSNTAPALPAQRPLPAPPRSSTLSIASRSIGHRQQVPPTPPKIPIFDWQTEHGKSRPSLQSSSDDDASAVSDCSFRTAGSTERNSERSKLKALHAEKKSPQSGIEVARASSSFAGGVFETRDAYHAQEKEQQGPPRPRHASESDLLLESLNPSYDDAPPSYYEMHGDSDPFDAPASSSRHQAHHFTSYSEPFASVPASPVNRVDLPTSRRPRRSTNAWPFDSGARFPVTFPPYNDNDILSAGPTGRKRNNELDLHSPFSAKPLKEKAVARAALKAESTDNNLPPLESSSSFASLPSLSSLSSPRTPCAFFAESPLAVPPSILPSPQQPLNSSSAARRRGRHNSRAKSESTPSTRCPTCFNKFASLEQTLEHLDSSDCGAVEFESGIM
ncbi:uncharacterized protein MEPE_04589 [Melanopsichium pennsylvanicum]|uniref:C2H2-type domain-containing protein n=2 Tax=Melanopsichium pennsylvanicum TaxID=63383 RepID=A0AAJ4XNI3_9BASI|nr:uncharacterized protein BN887_01839 [Melanopsichium pennsylvanicum 4]SNX85880.1 uncharacterized protein MEPE_04589 [Melanopsichium pennsylvanicum]